jgi:flagellar hook-basal body complex protein FliE
MAEATSVLSTSAIQGAYRSSQELSTDRAEAAAQPETSFSDMLRDVASGAVDTARTAEQAAEAGLKGELPTQNVVEATLELETTLRIAVSMRDKFVQAYQEVLRMPI